MIVDTLADSAPIKTRSIREFEGIGEHLRDEMDAQVYVNHLRDEWSERP